jgi:hypothetical protein
MEVIITPRTLDYSENEQGGENNKVRSIANQDAAQPTLTQTVSPGEDEDPPDASTNMPIGDLPGATISDADRKLLEVYGDYIGQNDGTHLDGGIKDDAVWQARWRKLVALPCQCYDTPGGSAG